MLNGTWAVVLAFALQAPPTSPPPQETTSDTAPVARFVDALGDDLKSLGTPDTAIIATAGVTAALLLHSRDDNLAEWARGRGDGGYASIGGFLGDGWLQAGSALGTYAIGSITDRPRVRAIGGDLVRGQILNGLVTRTLKAAVGRERPGGGRHSFPSGHASATFVSAAVLERHFGWRVGVPAYAAAGFVGWSRVRQDEHWLTDVIVGATLGTVIGRAVGSRAPRSWTVVPSASLTSAGVTFVKAGR